MLCATPTLKHSAPVPSLRSSLPRSTKSRSKCAAASAPSKPGTGPADTARRLVLAAWLLSEEHGWTVKRIAKAFHRSERRIASVLAGQPKIRPKRGRKSAVMSGFTLK